MKKTKKPDFLGLILPVGVILAWYLVCETKSVPAYILPPPQKVFGFLADFAIGPPNETAYSGLLLQHVLSSTARVATGFLTAAALGLPLGYLSGRVQCVYRVINPFIMLIRSIPGIAWLPVAIVWFGVGESNTLFLISLAAFFPIYMNTAHSAHEIDDKYISVARVFGATRPQMFRYVIFPLSFSGVTVGLRLGLGISWAYLVLGELTGVNIGIGAVMSDGRMLGQTHIIIVCMGIIAVLSIVTDILFKMACRIMREA